MRPTIYKSAPCWFTGVNILWQRSPCLRYEQVSVLKCEKLWTQLYLSTPLSSSVRVSARAKSRLPRDSFLSDPIPGSPEARIPTSSFRCLLKSVALCERQERGECEPHLPLQLSHGLDGHPQRAKHGGSMETSRLEKWLKSNTQYDVMQHNVTDLV